MTHPARWIAGSVAAVVVVLGVILAVNVGNDPEAGSHASPLQNKAVPAFDLPTLDGGRVTEAATTGKWTLVNFWNPWCTPCRQELPELRRFMRDYAGDDQVQMIGIVRDPQMSKAAVKKYATSEGMDWTLAWDPGDQAALDFATRGQPETFVVAPNGEVRAFFYGPVRTARELERALIAVGGPAPS